MAILDLVNTLSTILSAPSTARVSTPTISTPAALLADYLEREAVVSETIRPFTNGWVKFQGSWWSACCERDVTIPKGSKVEVVGCRNITLLVEPVMGG